MKGTPLHLHRSQIKLAVLTSITKAGRRCAILLAMLGAASAAYLTWIVIADTAALAATADVASANRSTEQIARAPFLTLKSVGEGTIVSAQWCGDMRLAYYNGDVEPYSDNPAEWPPSSYGIYIADLASGKTDRLDLPQGSSLIDCSPDGEWIIYSVHPKRNLVWRFNLKTKQSEKLMKGQRGSWSPDGQKLLFIRKPVVTFKTLAPRWQVISLNQNETAGQILVAWFPDSGSYLVARKDRVGNKHARYDFELRQLQDSRSQLKKLKVEERVAKYLHHLWIVQKNMILVALDVPDDQTRMKFHRELLQCKLDGDNLSCDTLISTTPRVSWGFIVSEDGRQAFFQRDDDPCLRRRNTNTGYEECLTIDHGAVLAVSPSGRWVAYSTREGEELHIIDLTATTGGTQ